MDPDGEEVGLVHDELISVGSSVWSEGVCEKGKGNLVL